MFKTLLGTLLIAFLAISCSDTAPTDNTSTEETTLQAPSRSSNTAEETDLLLARKWQSEGGVLLIDLSLDGTFIGEIEGQPIQGTWKTAADQLMLHEEKGLEGKGKALQQTYTIVSNTAESMILEEEGGKKWTLSPLD